MVVTTWWTTHQQSVVSNKSTTDTIRYTTMDESMRDASAELERCGRSVLDYDTPEELRQALEERMDPADGPCSEPPPGKSDWLLPVADPDAEPQSVENEMHRLLTLKSYLILDQAKEEAFDALTLEACQVYNVPTSLVSLIDLGRQFLFSNTGADVRETPRTPAFCSHTILSKTGICVVPDTILDQRFRNNCLVTGGPKLRFYAGAPLISPEGYKLGTFCVEGPDPRPEGLSDYEQAKLKEFAARAMDLMVDRRRTMQRAHKLANDPEHAPLRRHAAVTTVLGSLVYKHYLSESVLSMCLFQEAVQTLMRLEDHEIIAQLLPPERQHQMNELLEAMDMAESVPARDQVLHDLRALFPDAAGKVVVPIRHLTSFHKIPGTFGMSSKLKGSPQQQLQGLFFNEAFDVSLTPMTKQAGWDPHSSLDDRSFIIPLEQCSKATLFNMGLIHYHWGSADNAMQFFDLAASLSHPHEATKFDPVILASLNNMAQIHLQFGRAQDAMDMLTDALTRGNAALTTI
jgi:GAF domain-containing protein